jgi:WD40 repeat protein
VSAIFISHSTQDKAIALRVLGRLGGQGYRSVFVDSDPESGIKAGRDWERELYRNLKLAGAVVVLCSPASMASRWCIVEIAQAKALGKAIFPVVISECNVDALLTRLQVIDAIKLGEEEACRHLIDSLRIAGLDPKDSFDWKHERPPFPGFLCFDEEDAGIYFGRTEEVRQVIEKLTQLQRQDEPRLLVLVGSSGSGKSSLARAGVLPRLRKDGSRWAVVAPFRPKADPIGELARSLSETFHEAKKDVDWKDIRDRLLKEAQEPAADGSSALGDYADDLTMALGRREASVLLLVDQAEELLQDVTAPESSQFFTVLRQATSRPGGRLFALLTLRSDFLGTFQNHPELKGVAFADVPLGLLPVVRFPDVIENPAARAEIALDPGLVTAMIADAKAKDALPLLAFTLREMYERCRAQSKFTLSVYRDDLGGVEGVVEKVVARIKSEGQWTPETSRALRRAFLKLARVNEEGEFTRQTALWADLPDQAASVLDEFVKARLLSSHGGTVEVTHESLFRVWPDLADWLDEGRELMLWKRNLTNEVLGWLNRGRAPGYLLNGGRAAEAQRWLASHADEFHGSEVEFLKASVAEERKKQRRLQIFAGVVSGLIAIALGLGMFAKYKSQEVTSERRDAVENKGIANTKARIAASVQLANLSMTERNKRLDRSLLLAVESLRTEDTFEARDSLFRALRDQPGLRTFLTIEEYSVEGMAISPDGKRIATAQSKLRDGVSVGIVVLWDVAAKKHLGESPLTIPEGSVTSVAFSPDGTILAATYRGFVGGGVVLWDLAAQKKLGKGNMTMDGSFVETVAFSPDGKTLATGYNVPFGGGGVVLWDMTTQKRLGEGNLTVLEGGVGSVAFSLDGKFLAAGYQVVRNVDNGSGGGGGMVLWDVTARKRLGEGSMTMPESGAGNVAFSPDRKTLAFGHGSGVVLWDVAARKPLADGSLAVAEGGAGSVAFSADGKTLAATYGFVGLDGVGGGVLLWDAAVRKPLGEDRLAMPEGGLGSVAFSADGTLVAGYNSSVGSGVMRWDVTARKRVSEGSMIVPNFGLRSVAFSADGKTLAFANSAGDGVRLWDMAGRKPLIDSPLTVLEGNIWSVVFSPDGKTLAVGYSGSVGGGEVVLWDVAARKRTSEGRLAMPEGGVSSVAFSRDGKTLAAGYSGSRSDGGVVLWDVAARKRLGEGLISVPHGGVESIAFSADGKTLAAGYSIFNYRNGVMLWDVPARKPLVESPLTVLEGNIRGVVFSPDGKTLAAGYDVADLNVGHRGGIVLWDVTTCKRLGNEPVRVKKGRVVGLACSPDGKILAAGIGNGSESGVVLLDLDLESWQRTAGQIANRNFTRGEWHQYFPGEPYRPTFPNLQFPREVTSSDGVSRR